MPAQFHDRRRRHASAEVERAILPFPVENLDLAKIDHDDSAPNVAYVQRLIIAIEDQHIVTHRARNAPFLKDIPDRGDRAGG
jgi:hypothetical protein